MLEGGEVRCVRDVRCIVTSSKGKDPDSSDSKKIIYYSYILTCSVDSLGFFFFFSFLFFHALLDFIGTMKSN